MQTNAGKNPQKVVIIGGVAGGASAAARLRRNDEQVEIVLLEKGEYISFANCGMPYYIGEVIPKRDDLLLQTPRSLNARFNIDVRVKHEVKSIDRSKKSLVVYNGLTKTEYIENYDKLIIATGAQPIKLPFEGERSERIFSVWTLPDTDRLKQSIQDKQVKRAIIIGGGFVGLEMAENLRRLGIDVVIAEMAGQVMGTLDFDMAQILHQEIAANGVTLRLNQAVTAVRETADKIIVTLAGGDVVEGDILLSAAGIKPNSQLAGEAGLELGRRGHIVTDEFLQTADPDIYAVGDVIEVRDFVTGQTTAVPLAGPANKQGRIAADNISGARTPYRGTQGTSIAQVFGLTAASTGLNEKKLLAMGKKLYADYQVVYGHPAAHAGYYPGAKEIHCKLIFSTADHSILGVQAVGEIGVAKRVDVIATAMRLGAKVTDLTELELAYAPPYNTAKDPVNFMGYMAENIINDKVALIQWHEIDALDLTRVQLVDCRTIQEYNDGAICGSVNMPLNELRGMLAVLDRARPTVIYCKAGLRSYIGARILAQNGFSDVRSLTGGWTTYCFGKYNR